MRSIIVPVVCALAASSCVLAAPVDEVADAEVVKLTSASFDFTVSGAVSDSGTIDQPDLAECVAKQPGSLDLTINLAALGAPFDAEITLSGQELPGDVIQWSGMADINECVPVEFDGTMVNVLIRDVVVMLTAQAFAASPVSDADCDETFTVELVSTGGDAGNFITVQAFIECIQLGFFEINFATQNLMHTALGGAGNAPDLNGDGVVDGADLAILLAQWGTDGAADLNNDGVVNGADLAILLANWG